jgi:hypothetical protein
VSGTLAPPASVSLTTGTRSLAVRHSNSWRTQSTPAKSQRRGCDVHSASRGTENRMREGLWSCLGSESGFWPVAHDAG